MSLSTMARLKLNRELSIIKTDLSGLGDGPSATLKRLKMVARANLIRVELGGDTPAPNPAPNPAPVDEPVQQEPAEVGVLREVVAGSHDSAGLDALLTMIDKAARALHDVGGLHGEVEALAHDAITHWARLELAANG